MQRRQLESRREKNIRTPQFLRLRARPDGVIHFQTMRRNANDGSEDAAEKGGMELRDPGTARVRRGRWWL